MSIEQLREDIADGSFDRLTDFDGDDDNPSWLDDEDQPVESIGEPDRDARRFPGTGFGRDHQPSGLVEAALEDRHRRRNLPLVAQGDPEVEPQHRRVGMRVDPRAELRLRVGVPSLGKQRDAEEIRAPVGRPGSLAAQGSIKCPAVIWV